MQYEIRSTFGTPPTADAFMRASRIRRVIISLSSRLGAMSMSAGPLSKAYLNTLGISSGRLMADRVVAATKYQV